MIINRDKHNKYVVGWTPTVSPTTSSDTSSGGTTYVYVGGGGSSGSSIATQNSFAFYRVSDGETTIIQAATIPQDTANLVIKGDDNVQVTMVTEPTIFESQFVSTGTNKGVYKISYEKVTTYPEGEDSSNEEQEPIISYPLILTYVSGDKIQASHFDTLRLYKRVIQTTEEGEVEVEQEVKNYPASALTIEGDTAGINTITVDLYDPDSQPITFSRIALTYTEGEETTDILSFEVAMLTKAIMQLTAKGAEEDSYWKLDEEGNLYTEYNAYSIKELSAYGLGSGDTPSSGGTSYLHELLDVDAKNPTNGAILQYNTSTGKWKATTGGSFATQSWVNTQIELLVGAAPDVLDTLEELADALGNDPNFATTVTTMITDLDERVETLEQLLDWFSFVDGRVRVNYDFFGVREISAYGAGSGEPTSGVAYLHELKDVNLTDLQDDQLLMYNAATNLWVNVDKDQVGLNESQLQAYLIRNNYAKKSDITWSNVSGKPSIFNTTLSYINDLNTSWRDLLAQSPSEHVTRWPAFAEITNTPTTLSGYGITDAYTKTEADDRYVNITGDTMTGDLALPNMSATGYIQIGSARLEYDSTNNALKLSTSTGGVINFYSTGEVAAYGYDSTGSINISLEDLDNVVISSLTTGQVLQWDGTNWVNGTVEGGLDESALADYLTQNQYITQTTADGRYVNVTGDTMSGNLVVNATPVSMKGLVTFNNTAGGETYFYLQSAGTSYGAFTSNHSSYGTAIFDKTSSRYLGITAAGVPHFQGNTLLHAGNYTTYTVTKTGGGASGTWPISISGNAASATNADKLDGYHENSFFRKGISIIANETITNIPADRSGSYVLTHSGWNGSAFVLHVDTSNSSLGFVIKGGQYADVNLITATDNNASRWVDRGVLLTTSNYTSTLDSRYVNISGDTMSGTLTICTTGTNNYNQGIRINRTALSQWATLTIGYAGAGTSGTSANTWLIGTPSGSNSLIFNLNNSAETVGLCLKGHGNTDMKWNNNTVWHAGNDGSGSGLDADLLDGLHLGSMWIKKVYSINTSGLSTSNFYPIMFGPGADDLWVEIHSQGDISAAAYNTNRLNFVIHANGWDDSGKSLTILNRQVYQSNEITIGAIGYGNSEGMIAIWVRGGIGNIYIKSNFAPSLKTSNYTYGSQIFTVGTSYHGGTNTNVTVMWEYGSTTYDVALLSSNVASATKLQTARSLWGQPFDGTAPVSGNMTGVWSIIMNGSFVNNGGSIELFGSTPYIDFHYNNSSADYTSRLIALSSNNLNCTSNFTAPSFYASNWFRSTGATGWYSETYGGGWFMEDTSWLRAYNGKGVYTPGEMQCGVFNMTNYAGSSWQNGKGALNVQIYNNSSQTPLIVAYRQGYHYTVTGANRLFSMELLNNGSLMYLNFGGAMKYQLTSGGNFIATGEVTAYSDIRLKSNITNLIYRGRLQPKHYIKDNKESIGFIAQEVQELYPELVLECNDEHHYLALNYGNITAVLSAQINLVEDEVTQLKNRVQQLEQRLSKYEDVQ